MRAHLFVNLNIVAGKGMRVGRGSLDLKLSSKINELKMRRIDIIEKRLELMKLFFLSMIFFFMLFLSSFVIPYVVRSSISRAMYRGVREVFQPSVSSVLHTAVFSLDQQQY